MRCLTTTESLKLLQANTTSINPDSAFPKGFSRYELSFQIPVEARTQRLLARDLAGWLGGEGLAFFWLADWPFAKPDELAIATRLRAGHGEQRPLAEAPCHWFEAGERDEFTGWLGLAMSFGLEGSFGVLARPGGLLRVTREEFIRVATPALERQAGVRDFALRYELDIYREGSELDAGTGSADNAASPESAEVADAEKSPSGRG